MTTRQRNKIDKLVENFYSKHAQGAQIDVMDIGKVFDEGYEAFKNGDDLEQSVIASIKKYTFNGIGAR